MDLEDLIEKLVNEIKDYPKNKDKKKVLYITKQIEYKIQRNNKQYVKDTLLKYLGFNPKDKIQSSLSTIVNTFIFLYDINADVKKVIIRFSKIFTYKKRCKKKRIRCLTKLGIEKRYVRKIINKFPQIFSYSEKYIKEGIKDLINLGIKKEDIGIVITKFPPIIELDIKDTIEPKLKYIKSMGYNVDIASFPQVSGYSMVDRIIPRLEILEIKGNQKYSLNRILSRKDKYFAEKIAKIDYKIYQDFLNKLKARFSKQAKKSAKKALEEWNELKEEFLSRYAESFRF